MTSKLNHSCWVLPMALAACVAAPVPPPPVLAPAPGPVTSPPPVELSKQRLAVGHEHVCQLLDDGNVRCAGDNRLDQLGDGFSPYQLEPAEVPGLSDITSVTMFDALTCALDARGKVFCFGDGVAAKAELPLPKVLAMMAGQGVMFVQLEDGRFARIARSKLFDGAEGIDLAGGPKFRGARLVVGGNVYLPSGERADPFEALDRERRLAAERRVAAERAEQQVGSHRVTKPVLRTGVTHHPNQRKPSPKAVASALARAVWTDGSLALDTDGSFRYVDRLVAKNAAVEALSEPLPYPRARHYAPGSHSCAAGWEGEVYCVGNGGDGQLGYPASPYSSDFGRVEGLADVVQVAVGRAHSCALGQDGNVRCWGANYSGQLGDGTRSQRLEPTLVKGLSGVRSIFAHTAQTCAILQSGKLSCWGWGERGQLGLAARQRKLSGQSQVANLDRAVSIAAGATHTCALDAFGIASCWGQPTHGDIRCRPVGAQLLCQGQSSSYELSGRVTLRSTPEREPSLSGGSALWANGDFTCSDPQGRFRCLALTSEDPPKEVRLPVLAPSSRLSVAEAMLCAVVGGSASCSPRVEYWAEERLASLAEFTPVPGLSNVEQLGIGEAHACARSSAGEVHCWGQNPTGQLGTGDTQDSQSPRVVEKLPPATALAVGAYHACALLKDGTVRCWGHAAPMVWSDPVAHWLAPETIPGLSDVVELAAAGETTCARKRDGSVHCWGKLGGLAPSEVLARP